MGSGRRGGGRDGKMGGVSEIDRVVGESLKRGLIFVNWRAV